MSDSRTSAPGSGTMELVETTDPVGSPNEAGPGASAADLDHEVGKFDELTGDCQAEDETWMPEQTPVVFSRTVSGKTPAQVVKNAFVVDPAGSVDGTDRDQAGAERAQTVKNAFVVDPAGSVAGTDRDQAGAERAQTVKNAFVVDPAGSVAGTDRDQAGAEGAQMVENAFVADRAVAVRDTDRDLAGAERAGAVKTGGLTEGAGRMAPVSVAQDMEPVEINLREAAGDGKLPTVVSGLQSEAGQGQTGATNDSGSAPGSAGSAGTGEHALNQFGSHSQKNSRPGREGAEQTQESLESRIGQYWLSRVGIASLVIGFASLLMYSFQYFGAEAKLAVGVLVSAFLIAGGEWLHRKNEDSSGMRRFALTLMGGGWGLTFFTAYASHFVPEVAVVHSATAGGALMLAVAAGATAHAVIRRSEFLGTAAILLGYTGLVATGTSTPLAIQFNVLVLGASAILAVWMQWHRLLLYSVIGAYVASTPLFASRWATTFGFENSILIAAQYVLYWLVFTGALVGMKRETPDNRRWLVGAAVVNFAAS